MRHRKPFKVLSNNKFRMFPSDPAGSLDDFLFKILGDFS